MKNLAAALILSLATLTAQARTFHDIIVFGDSLSDNGNLYSASLHVVPKSPPYYQGHFTNGEVWVEKLAEEFSGGTKILNDYAVGGASAVLHLIHSKLPYSIGAEIDEFELTHYFSDKSQYLFILWVGGNDYLVDPDDHAQTAQSVVDSIGEKIESLIHSGGRLFLIPNLPDIALTPEANIENMQADMHDYSERHNALLQDKLNTLREKYADKGVKIISFDVYGLYQEMMQNPNDFGLTDIINPCYSGSIFLHDAMTSTITPITDLLPNMSEDEREAMLANPSLRATLLATAAYENQKISFTLANNNSCAGKLFWDDVHPTTRVHALIAKAAYDVLIRHGVKFNHADV